VKSAAHPSRVTSWWIILCLVVGTLLIYWPVNKSEFVNYDDTDFVTSNPHVQAGLTPESFQWAWHSEVARNWHPITMLSHMLDCQLWNLNAGRHHFTNLLLHIANTVLLFLLLRLMTGALWRSAFVAALFAWHPLHVESVAWVAERKDVLSTFFLFLTFCAYVLYTRGKSMKFYALAILLFALGLMSKPMVVTAPFVMLLLDYWPLGRMRSSEKQQWDWRIILEKLPFFAMSAVLCVITYEIQKNGGAMMGDSSLPLGARLENAVISYVRYIGKMFWPENLAGLYLRPGGWHLWQAVLAAVILVIVSIIAIKEWERRPWLLVGWCWYLGVLVPVIGIVQVGMQTMADRFTYVPLVGLFIIVAWGAQEAATAWRLPDFTLAIAAAIPLTSSMFLTARQVGYWKNSEALFTRMIAVTDNNFMAHYNLANLYSRQQRTGEALANYQMAVEEEPNYADAHNNYGGLLLELKRYDEAIKNYADAARINPQYIYFLNLANALADAASARHDTNQFALAVSAYGEAVKRNPQSTEARVNLALTWEAQGRDAEAVAAYREALQINPDVEPAHFSVAEILARLGKIDEAIPEYRAAIQLNPNHVESFNGLGVCYAMKNDMSDAETQFRKVIELQPGNSGANGNLGNVLAAQNRMDEAIQYYQAALRLNPRDYQTEFNLGLSLARRGQRDEAKTHYRQALRLKPDYEAAQQALQDMEKGAVNQR